MDELVAADLIAQERKRKMRLIRDCRTLLEPALRANGDGGDMMSFMKCPFSRR